MLVLCCHWLSENHLCCDWLFQSELQECQSRLRDLEAEFQRANNKAYNAEHQLTQLSLKVRRPLMDGLFAWSLTSVLMFFVDIETHPCHMKDKLHTRWKHKWNHSIGPDVFETAGLNFIFCWTSGFLWFPSDKMKEEPSHFPDLEPGSRWSHVVFPLISVFIEQLII